MSDLPVEKEGTNTTTEYQVTDTGCQCLEILTFPLHFLPFLPGFVGKKTLVLEDEEVVFHTTHSCCNVERRGPYGELGSVEKVHCLCCVGVKSNLACFFPGWGCQSELVDKVVSDLKRRMKARGDTGQIQRAEQTLQELQELKTQMKSMQNDMSRILEALHVPPSSEDMRR